MSKKVVASKIINHGLQDQFTTILYMCRVINVDFSILGHWYHMGKLSQMVGEFVDQKKEAAFKTVLKRPSVAVRVV